MSRKKPLKKNKLLSYVLLGAILVLGVYMQWDEKEQTQEKPKYENNVQHQNPENNSQSSSQPQNEESKNSTPTQPEEVNFSSENKSGIASIGEMTDEEVVVKYLKEHQELPEYYITKKEAQKEGWQSGDLCNVIPGKAIGGDHFGNFEKRLPQKNGREYREADINYDCGKRTADRVVYSNDGLIFITKDHYQTFEEQ